MPELKNAESVRRDRTGRNYWVLPALSLAQRRQIHPLVDPCRNQPCAFRVVAHPSSRSGWARLCGLRRRLHFRRPPVVMAGGRDQAHDVGYGGWLGRTFGHGNHHVRPSLVVNWLHLPPNLAPPDKRSSSNQSNVFGLTIKANEKEPGIGLDLFIACRGMRDFLRRCYASH